MIQRLLEIKEHVISACRELQIDGLLESQWKQLERLYDILEPYAKWTLELEAYKTTTLSLVALGIKELTMHTEKVSCCGNKFALCFFISLESI